MKALAVIIEKPERLVIDEVELSPPGDEDVVVDIEWSGISTGTERLLWLGRMPSFPGMGYPLIPGYELIGRVSFAGGQLREPAGRPGLRSRRALLQGCARTVRRRRFARRGSRTPRARGRRRSRRRGRPAGAGRDRVSRDRRICAAGSHRWSWRAGAAAGAPCLCPRP